MGTDADTIVIGAGQAGLATSYCLKQRGVEHVVLEQSDVAGSAWRDGRWDSFTLVTPNWSMKLPGDEYRGDDPDGYLPRDEIVASFREYAEKFALPVRYQTRVHSVEREGRLGRYVVRTSGGMLEAANVVVATGLFQTPRRPAFASAISDRVTQVPSSEYRNPDSLPDGRVLVVGSAQSGCQIADELRGSGRDVYLCVGGAGRAPRRYRGRDIIEWMYLAGLFDLTVDSLPSPKAKFTPNPHVSGRDGGRTLNLHAFARDGIRLLGHLRDARGERVWLAPDLTQSLARVDQLEADLLATIDAYIARTGVDAPTEAVPILRDGYDAEVITELDLLAAGVSAIVWAIGYTFDFSWVALPVFDDDGFPIQTRGVSSYPGLYFVGLPWLHKRKSGLLMGVGEDAEFIAEKIVEGA